MLTQFQMWKAHLGQINVSNYRIGFLKDTSKPVHSTFYHAGLTTRESEEVEIEKVLDRKEVESAQTKWAEPIVLALNKNKLCASSSTIADSIR